MYVLPTHMLDIKLIDRHPNAISFLMKMHSIHDDFGFSRYNFLD